MHMKSPGFGTTVGADGTIRLPEHVLELLDITDGAKVHVTVSSMALAAALKGRRVEEEEIDRIAKIQLESREQVITFLLSEGSARGKFRARLKKAGTRK